MCWLPFFFKMIVYLYAKSDKPPPPCQFCHKCHYQIIFLFPAMVGKKKTYGKIYRSQKKTINMKSHIWIIGIEAGKKNRRKLCPVNGGGGGAGLSD